MLATPYDGRIYWVHWKGVSVEERTIAELADTVRRETPNVSGVFVKSSDGSQWQGHFDSKPSMAVVGPLSLQQWAQALESRGLELHLWSVLNGLNPEREARPVIDACNTAGVRSMLLDIETGRGYFQGDDEAARALITTIRDGIPDDFHLGLNFNALGSHPQGIHFDEWRPHVQSLHPMVYHHAFDRGGHSVAWWLDHILDICSGLAPELPVVPMLGTYPTVDHDLVLHPVPPQDITAGIHHALEKAGGVSLYRIGNTGASDCSPPEMMQAVAAATDTAPALPDATRPAQTFQRIGLNINAVTVDKGKVLATCKAIRASSHLIMNDFRFGQQLHEALDGKCIIVTRDDWPDNTTDVPVDTLLSRWEGRASLAPDVYHYFPNEPIPNDACPLPELLELLVALMRACRVRGVKACIGNFPTARVLHNSDVQQGIWDDFIREASAFTANGQGYIGFHDYTFGVLPWGCAGRKPQQLIDQPERVGNPDNWPTQAEIFANPGGNYHLLRWAPLVVRAGELGLPMFRILVTEFGWDRMPNLIDEKVIPWFDREVAETRGPLSQNRKLSPLWFGVLKTPLENALAQLQWAENTYPDYVDGLHLFTWSGSDGWQDFNYGVWEGALEALEGLQAHAWADPEDKPAPDSDPPAPLATLPEAGVTERWQTIVNRVRIREQPDIQAPVSGSLEYGEAISELARRTTPDYRWIRHSRGWSASGPADHPERYLARITATGAERIIPDSGWQGLLTRTEALNVSLQAFLQELRIHAVHAQWAVED